MNKTTNNFRKCAFCPHHGQQNKCCCRKDKKRIQSQKKPINNNKTLKNESMIDFPNYSQIKLNEINIPTLIAQNSFLKSANNQLRNDLISVSHFMKDDKIPFKQYLSVSTVNTLKTQAQQILSDKLYLSNKKLQQTILKLDSLSRYNKQLLEKNIFFQTQLSSLKFQNQALNEQIDNLKKKLKKNQCSLNQSQANVSNKQEYKILKQKFENVKIQNGDLHQQIQRLNNLLKAKRNEECMSPEWIAETSNKLNFIQCKIDNHQKQRYVQKQNYYQDSSQNLKKNNYFQLIHNLKQELALSINIIHTKTRKFISVFDTVGNVQNINIKSLICSMMQGFMQNCINLTYVVQNELTRKIVSVEKRMEYLLGKLQNFVLEIKNRQLRKRSTSRSRIVINYQNNKNVSSKGAIQCKSPLGNRMDKQNYNMINRIDKTC